MSAMEAGHHNDTSPYLGDTTPYMINVRANSNSVDSSMADLDKGLRFNATDESGA